MAAQGCAAEPSTAEMPDNEAVYGGSHLRLRQRRGSFWHLFRILRVTSVSCASNRQNIPRNRHVALPSCFEVLRGPVRKHAPSLKHLERSIH